MKVFRAVIKDITKTFKGVVEKYVSIDCIVVVLNHGLSDYCEMRVLTKTKLSQSGLFLSYKRITKIPMYRTKEKMNYIIFKLFLC